MNYETEIVHLEIKSDNRVKVYIEKPVCGGFHNATCYLPDYTWENINGFSDEKINYFRQLIEDNAHLIIEFSQRRTEVEDEIKI